MSTRKQCSPDTTEYIRTPGNCDSTHMTWEGSSKSNPAWRGEMNTKFHALANEQLTTGSFLREGKLAFFKGVALAGL